MSEFEPKNVGLPADEIIPKSRSDIDIAEAQADCAAIAEELSSTISGIGPKAAERYLLRYEYGFRPKTIAEKYEVTSQTVTNQTSDVRERTLQHPKLAQTIGRFRSKRTKLNKPIFSDSLLWDKHLDIQSTEIDAQVVFHPGSFLTDFSWKYTLHAKVQVENKNRHLIVDYQIHDELGVLLKRSLRGISSTSSQQMSYFGPKWHYTVYPLPNPDIPSEDATLVNAVEYHVTYDMTTTFAGDYVEQDWTALEMDANLSTEVEHLSPQLSLPEFLVDQLKQGGSINDVHRYTQLVNLRKNVERILRLYPLEDISQIPLDTIQLLWDGPLTYAETDKPGKDVLQYALETSRITLKPGNRLT